MTVNYLRFLSKDGLHPRRGTTKYFMANIRNNIPEVITQYSILRTRLNITSNEPFNKLTNLVCQITRDFFALETYETAAEGIQHGHAKAVVIGLGHERLMSHFLGRGKERRGTLGLVGMGRLHKRETEIHHYRHMLILLDDDILRLQIAVDDAVTMNIVKG